MPLVRTLTVLVLLSTTLLVSCEGMGSREEGMSSTETRDLYRMSKAADGHGEMAAFVDTQPGSNEVNESETEGGRTEFGTRLSSGERPSSEQTEEDPATLQLTSGGYRRPFSGEPDGRTHRTGPPQAMPNVVYSPPAVRPRLTPGYFMPRREPNMPPEFSAFRSPLMMEQLFQPPSPSDPLIAMFQRNQGMYPPSYGFEPIVDNSRQDVSAYADRDTPLQLQATPDFYGAIPNNFLSMPVSFQQKPLLPPSWYDRRENREEMTSEENKSDNKTVESGERDRTDVYMRYPTNEAGYATQENLPLQKNASDDGAISPNSDPYRTALQNVLAEQRRMVQQPPRGYALRSPVDPFQGYGDPFQAILVDNRNQQREEPACAQNRTVCFEDPEYPRNEVIYALNSDPFLLDRMANLDRASLVLAEGNASEEYSCPAEVTQATPKRAKNVAGAWKVVVAVEGRIAQPLRTEECRSAGQSCRFSSQEVRTRCVQKYALHRLFSWSRDLGLHLDLFRLPVACACALESADA